MASYRFCRSDDLGLLVEAHEACYRPHFPGSPPLAVDDLKRAAREIDFWTSSCMVAAEGSVPVAVLLACKRDSETLVWRIGVHPDHRRCGHARHLLTSLSAKLAILGPPRMLAEVPAELSPARELFGACGWRSEVEYTDFLRRAGGPTGSPSNLVIPITLDELFDNGELGGELRRPWERTRRALAQRGDAIRGLAVVSTERIESWLLFDEIAETGERRIVAVGGRAEPERADVWRDLLLRQLSDHGSRGVRYPRVHPDELSREALGRIGFEEVGRTIGLAVEPQPG